MLPQPTNMQRVEDARDRQHKDPERLHRVYAHFCPFPRPAAFGVFSVRSNRKSLASVTCRSGKRVCTHPGVKTQRRTEAQG